LERLAKFLNSIGSYEKIVPIEKEASVRNYYRVYYEEGTKILCLDENFKSLPYPILEVNQFLIAEGFSVPKIIQYDPEIGRKIEKRNFRAS
jgi:aminoglycoside/choline kinase family phosphotransferase